jgi:hypothetical protein
LCDSRTGDARSRRIVCADIPQHLIGRTEIGTEKHHPWWVEALTPASTLAEEFAESHGRRAGEVMATHVISATEDTPLSEIAHLVGSEAERKALTALAEGVPGVVGVSDEMIAAY